MSLPKNEYPVYEVILPSNKRKISIRPFLVKEEKIMLMAAQSNDPGEIKQSIKQIVTNCILDKNYNVDEMPIFDVEFVLINLRIRSIGDKLELKYVCDTVQENGEACGEPFSVNVDLKDIITTRTDPEKKTIQLSDKLGVKMRYPRFSVMTAEETNDYTLLTEAVESIYEVNNEKGVYPLKDQKPEEIAEFFDGLTMDQFNLIQGWLSSLPKYSVEKVHKCTKCGTVHEIKVDDLQSFF